MKSKYFFYIIIVLFWIIFPLNLFFGEITNIYNGCGFDGGMFYAPVVKNFWSIAQTGSFDSYSFSKILPQFLIASFCKVLSIQVTDQVIISGYKTIHFTAIMVSWMFVFRFFVKQNLDYTKKSLLIIFLYFNYPLLKLAGFVPVSPDASVYAIGIISAYYVLTNNINGLFISSLFGMFMIPSFLIFYLPFFLFKQIESDNLIFKPIIFLRWSLVLAYAGIAFAVIIISYSFLFNWNLYKDELIFNVMYTNRPEAFMFALYPISLIIACLYVYYSTQDILLKYKIKDMLKAVSIKGIILWLILFCIYLVLADIFVNPNLPKRSGLIYIFMNFFTRSLQYPAHFIFAKILYFGPFVVFLIFYWKKIKNIFVRKGYGYVLFTLVFLAFNLLSESRFFLHLMPIYIYLLMQHLIEVKIKDVFIILILSVILSRVWFHIGSLDGDIYGASMQRFQLGNGPFNSKTSYLITAFSSITTICIYYFFLNRSTKKD
jgi:hypothetical protein